MGQFVKRENAVAGNGGDEHERGAPRAAGAATAVERAMVGAAGLLLAVVVLFATGVEAQGTNTPATGAPSIAGAVQVGETLTAGLGTITDADGLPSTTFPSGYTFRWQYRWGSTTPPEDRIGAAGGTYTPVDADTTGYLRVRVSFTDGAGNSETRASAWTNRVIGDANVCDRTQAVRTKISAMLGGADCDYVTNSALATIDILSLPKSIRTLQAGDFDGLTGLNRLILTKNQLTSLPPGIFDELTELRYLILTKNQLTSLPSGIFDELTELRYLDLEDNRLASLPTGIFDELTALTRLDLDDNRLSSLSADIFSPLTKLETLCLNGNGLTSLPTGIFDELTALTRVDLHENALTPSGLPAGIFGELTALERLFLHQNALTSLPADILEGLENLEVLYLAGNGLSSLPADLFADPTALRELTLTSNGLSSLPVDIFDSLEDLTWLSLGSNPWDFTLTAGDATGTADDTAEVTVTLSHILDYDLELTVGTGGTAVAGTDYTAPDTTLTVTAGQTSASLDIEILADATSGNTIEVGFTDGPLLLLTQTPYPSETETISTSATATVTIGTSMQVALDPLTISSHTLPSSHDGSPFTFRLTFSEAVTTTAGDLGAALTVGGGAMTGVTNVDDGGVEFDITITPDGTDSVTVLLPATADCAADGAICTAGGAALAAGMGADLPHVASTRDGNPLTAAFSSVPSAHNGSRGFWLDLVFSEEPVALKGSTVKTHLFDVTGGTIKRARRIHPSSNEGFRLRVKPTSSDAVTLTLRDSLPACGEARAVCTADDRALAGPVTATVAGLPGLSVADAEVEEGPNAELAFAVTLSHAAAGTVTVGYMTSNGTSRAGEDYTATSGLLTFAAGETAKTVSVPVLDDAHDEGSETLELVLMNASGASIAPPGRATGTINNSGQIPQAWMARFGRTVADQVLDAVQGRMTAARVAGVDVSVAGRRFDGAAMEHKDRERHEARAEALAEWVRGEADGERAFGSRELTPGDLLAGSSFALTGGTAESGFGTVWGRGAISRFEGREGDLSLDGKVRSVTLGADWLLGRGTAGLALSHSRGTGGYRASSRSERNSRASSQSGDGEIEATLTGLYPYGHYEASERLTLWGAGGFGTGTLTLTTQEQGGEQGQVHETDMDLAMGAVGGRRVLVKAPADGGLELAAKSDALVVRTTSEAVHGSADKLAASEAKVTRVRLGLEGTWHGVATGSATLVPQRGDWGAP